jgi:hypothetical protein
MIDSPNKIMAVALEMAAKGRRVMPVGTDKKPLVKDWPQKATTEKTQIRAWFDQTHPPNLAVTSGDASGFFALDVDGPEGQASLAALEQRHEPLKLEEMAIATTPSGWYHFYFQMPAFNLRNSAGQLGPGLDIRANGGYVLVPPSRAIGHGGQMGDYDWFNNKVTLTEGDLPKAPAWLLNLLQPDQQSEAQSPPSVICTAETTNYGQAALTNQCQQVAAAPVGTRNDTLNRAAFSIFQLVVGGEIEDGEAERRLMEAAEASGLPRPEILATLNSARAKAWPNPRSASRPPSSVWVETPNEENPENGFQEPDCLPPPPLEALPPTIQNLLLEAALVFGDLPLEVPTVSFLAFLSGCVGQSVVLEVKKGWLAAGNLYFAIVAPSGLGKSPCANAFLRPIWRLDHKARERWKSEMTSYQTALEERKQAQNSTDPAPPVPLLTQYIVDDATLEAISGILAENPRGLLWCCDELATLMQNLDRYTNGRSSSKGRLLSSYDCSPWKTSRCDREKNQSVLAAVLSIFGTIQPKSLKSVFSQKDADSGLLPRFACILARRDKPPRLTDEEFKGEVILTNLAELLLNRKMTELDGQLIPEMVRLSDEANGLYKKWSRELTQTTWEVSEIDRLIVPKVAGMVPRLALLLHVLASTLEALESHLPVLESESLKILPEVSYETMTGAIRFGDWIYRHQKYIWLSMGLDNEPLKTPLDEAVMRTALGLADYLADNGWRILNDDFNALVQQHLPKDTAHNHIGRATNRLGVKSIKIGLKRGKEFSPELLDKFRLGLYL